VTEIAQVTRITKAADLQHAAGSPESAANLERVALPGGHQRFKVRKHAPTSRRGAWLTPARY
jgi:hypothetical protein